jgi:7,8-dihydropterin-6-yl-methyl-4-(beta-D-ribofuranosyl)aminobenzene 5'-phosphate synthase
MVEFLKITVVNDNEGTNGLMNGWGWSALIESESWRMIFDAGPDPRILENNSRTMNIDLKSISFGFLSHDHFDHSGGFAALAGLKVYVPDISGYLKSVGINQILVREPVKLEDGIWSSGAMNGLSVIEHFVVINHKNFGNVMIVGCSHPGIDVMLGRAEGIYGKIKMLLGGFHNPTISKMENVLKRCDTVLPSHCSGSKAKAMARINSKYFEIRTGTAIVIDESGSLTHSYFVN